MNLQEWLTRERPTYEPKHAHWCNTCGGKHKSNVPCQLAAKHTIAKSGEPMKTFVRCG